MSNWVKENLGLHRLTWQGAREILRIELGREPTPKEISDYIYENQ